MPKKKVSLPKYVHLSYLKIKLEQLDSELSYQVADQQGSFVEKPPATIYLDKEIIERGGLDAVNLVIHEMCHAIEYLAQLTNLSVTDPNRAEEGRVTAYSNYLTEIISKSELRDWIRDNT
tara:strand:- start:9614 stop:9973 length:360 start_codon:yes stop_codon:yes gene_type:complete